MNSLGDILHSCSELRFIAEALQFSSPLGRKKMIGQPFLFKYNEIEGELNKTAAVISFLNQECNKRSAEAIAQILHQVRDIETTLRNLQASMVLDDIELFEIKKFALLVSELNEIISAYHLVSLKDTEAVITLLDPEHKRIPRFFIYDEYDERLAPIRKKLKQLSTPPKEKAVLEAECLQIEETIRQQLSDNLQVHYKALHESFEAIAELDYLFAKAMFSINYNCCRPVIASEETVYSGLFNIEVQELLKKRGQQFQPVDISIFPAPCIITGANMGGKTILLKALLIAQYLFQFGFFVPATKASIVPAEKILYSFEPLSNSKSGLSSFATEIVRINSILQEAKSNKNILVLLDEPAQTTNPAEGTALVSAMASILQENRIRSLVTTHYNNIAGTFRRLNVKGLKIPSGNINVTADNISAYMDYSLEENLSGIAPENALQVAAMLGVDEELLRKAKDVMQQTNRQD